MAAKTEWIDDVRGPDGQPVPPSVLAELYRYRKSSWSARRRHSAVELAGLAAAAAIPVLAAFAVDSRLLAVVGSVVVLINGVRALGAYKENWTSRTRARYAIEKEIALFAVHHGRYAGPDATTELVEAVEDICAKERDGWVALRLSYNATEAKAVRG